MSDSKGSVLWIDSFYEVLKDLADPLREQGYTVDGTETFDEAREILGRTKYDALIVELITPNRIEYMHGESDTPGVAFLQELRQQEGPNKYTPAVVCTIVNQAETFSLLHGQQLSELSLWKGNLRPSELCDTVLGLAEEARKNHTT